MSFDEFVAKYFGVLCGNTPQNRGQCVGLVSLWMDNLGIPHEWGDAKDLLANADPNAFEVIYNDPNDLTQHPETGDIFVYDSTWGEGAGHTGLVVVASGTSLVGFEQNNPGAPAFVLHNYDHLLGWLRPKNHDTENSVPSTPTFTDQTPIPVGGEWGTPELQALRSTLNDLKRDRDGNLAQAGDLSRQLKECINKPQNSPEIVTVTKEPVFTHSLSTLLYQFAKAIG